MSGRETANVPDSPQQRSLFWIGPFPVAFISGITGRLYQQFALTIAISVQRVACWSSSSCSRQLAGSPWITVSLRKAVITRSWAVTSRGWPLAGKRTFRPRRKLSTNHCSEHCMMRRASASVSPQNAIVATMVVGASQKADGTKP